MSSDDIIYFIAQGLTISGLLVVSISGLKTSDREIIESVYQNKSILMTESKGDDVYISRNDIRHDEIKNAIKEKTKFVFGFIFSFFGILMEVIFNEKVPDIFLNRIMGTVVSTVIFTGICFGIKLVYVKYKSKKVECVLNSGFKVELKDGDTILDISD